MTLFRYPNRFCNLTIIQFVRLPKLRCVTNFGVNNELEIMMDKKTLIEKLNDAKTQLESVQDSTAHVGIALELTAYVREYMMDASPEMADRIYDDPFFAYFQNASHDTHTQFPIRKMSMLSAITGYIRYLGGDN